MGNVELVRHEGARRYARDRHLRRIDGIAAELLHRMGRRGQREHQRGHSPNFDLPLQSRSLCNRRFEEVQCVSHGHVSDVAAPCIL